MSNKTFEKVSAEGRRQCELEERRHSDISFLLQENAKLRELVRDFDMCLDTALWLASEAGYPVMPDQKLFDSLRPRMRELGVEA